MQPVLLKTPPPKVASPLLPEMKVLLFSEIKQASSVETGLQFSNIVMSISQQMATAYTYSHSEGALVLHREVYWRD